MKQRLLWIGDAACQSGFARVTHAVLDVLQRYWDVYVLGINYLGDPHGYTYPIYPCFTGGDAFGYGRLPYVLGATKPNVVVIQNDPWNFPPYMAAIRKQDSAIPIVGMVAVDALNCRGTALNGLALGCFWTQFGVDQARRGGFTGPAAVVPLGVDLDVFQPMDRTAARIRLGMPARTSDGKHALREAFIFGNVNRNQQRKRLDLTIRYFARWLKESAVTDAYLMLHVAPTGDRTGYDCRNLADYYGVKGRLILREPDVRVGPPDRSMVPLYAALDAQVSTTQGEGWGLTTMEGMACGVPQIVPRWSALAEWAAEAAIAVECNDTCVTPDRVNTIGGIPDEDQFVAALDRLYRDEGGIRRRCRERGLELVAQPQYRWPTIGERFAAALDEALVRWQPPVEQPQEPVNA